MLTLEELDEVAAELPLIKAWIDSIETRLIAALESGVEFKNVELVPKRANRKWVEGAEVLPILLMFSDLETVAPRTLMSPSQAEKALGRKAYREALAEFVVRESSGMNLGYIKH